MEYQKIINLLDDKTNETSGFRTEHRVETNDDAHQTYSTETQVKFKTTMIRSNLYDYGDA